MLAIRNFRQFRAITRVHISAHRTNHARCFRGSFMRSSQFSTEQQPQRRSPDNPLIDYFRQFPASFWNSDLRRVVLNPEEQSDTASCLIVPLHRRSMVELRGEDTVKLLQGMTTRDMIGPFESDHVSDTSYGMVTAVPTHALNVRGRVLFDALVSRRTVDPPEQDSSCILIECDRTLLDSTVKHFTRHRLRSKVKISKDIDASTAIFHIIPKINPQTGEPDTDAVRQWLQQLHKDARISEHYEVLWFADPRLESLGFRLYFIARSPGLGDREVIQKDVGTLLSSDKCILSSDEQVYEQWRMINGIAEGAIDVPFENGLPLEANIDFLNGVHFNKGCYVGQELTARTHFRGQVRKRIMPVVAIDESDHPLPPAETKLNRLSDVEVDSVADGGQEESAESARMRERRLRRGVGKMCSSSGQIGLAVVQLADRHETFACQTSPENGERRLLRAVVPFWMRDIPDTPDDEE